KVIRGNTLVIPIGKSNLYVEPLYLQADTTAIPELKEVVLSTGNRVVMQPTLEAAISKLFGIEIGSPGPAATAPAAPDASSGAPAGSPAVADLVRSAHDP